MLKCMDPAGKKRPAINILAYAIIETTLYCLRREERFLLHFVMVDTSSYNPPAQYNFLR